MRKIFLDVGGHNGQTLNEVLSDKYKFDKVHCFEPMPNQISYLKHWFIEKQNRPLLELHNYGLLDVNCNRIIYGSNEDMASSIYKESGMYNSNFETMCEFRSVSEFFENNIQDDDVVIMKLNCEGSEVIIVNNLLDTGQIKKVYNMMIDFDIRKVDGHESDADDLLKRFEKVNFTNFSLVDVMKGETHTERIANWLSTLDL